MTIPHQGNRHLIAGPSRLHLPRGPPDFQSMRKRQWVGLILAAAATWAANWITERIFGPEEIFEDA